MVRRHVIDDALQRTNRRLVCGVCRMILRQCGGLERDRLVRCACHLTMPIFQALEKPCEKRFYEYDESSSSPSSLISYFSAYSAYSSTSSLSGFFPDSSRSSAAR